jgi:hypothetical protein
VAVRAGKDRDAFDHGRLGRSLCRRPGDKGRAKRFRNLAPRPGIGEPQEAEATLKAFAEKQAADVRDKRLTQVFASLFSTMNNQRKSVITGIGKYQKSQKDRSAELERQGVEIANLEKQAQTDEKVAADLATAQEHFQWAQRIFQDRQQNIPLACELPIVIEQRLYQLAQSIRGLMKS